MNKRQKGLAQFLIPRGNAAKLFEVVKESFDLLASLIEVFLIVERGCPVALWRDHRDHILLEEVLSDAITIIPLVHDGRGERRVRRHLGEHGRKDGTLMTVPCRQDERDARALIATAGMDVGGQAASRAPQSLCGLPAVLFNAPAAC
jgi:hypothetical protein